MHWKCIHDSVGKRRLWNESVDREVVRKYLKKMWSELVRWIELA